MVDSLHAQVRLIEDLRATNAAQETTILELRAENERLKETIEVLKEAIETLKAEIRQLKRLPGKPDIKPGSGGKGEGGKDLEGGRRSSGTPKKRRGPKRGRRDAKRVVLSVQDAPEGSVHAVPGRDHPQIPAGDVVLANAQVIVAKRVIIARDPPLPVRKRRRPAAGRGFSHGHGRTFARHDARQVAFQEAVA